MRAGEMMIVVGVAVIVCAARANESEQRAALIQKLKDHCESEGKQAIVRDVKQDKESKFFTNTLYTTVAGECVGPDDPGYLPSNSKLRP